MDTQSRILEAAWALVRERGAGAVRIGEIAAAAGVSRQLVYFHFENRAGLLLAMARHHDVESGFVDRAWYGYIPGILPVARALEAAVVTGDDGGAAWLDRMEDLWEAFRVAVGRVARDGRLAEGWSVEGATDWVWARSHLTAWQHLVGERGWSPDDYEERSVRSIMAEVLAPGPRQKPSKNHSNE
jgi:AcrR family transcriptional regulator